MIQWLHIPPINLFGLTTKLIIGTIQSYRSYFGSMILLCPCQSFGFIVSGLALLLCHFLEYYHCLILILLCIHCVMSQHLELRDPAEEVIGSPMEVGFDDLLDVSEEEVGVRLPYPPDPR